MNYPPGLENLSNTDYLFLRQKVDLTHAVTGYKKNNEFAIQNRTGRTIYNAVENSYCCTRNCCGAMRPFDMKILDNYRNEVIHIYRHLRCFTCWFPCCLQKMEVSAPPGTIVGTVEQEWSICYPTFAIKNHMGKVVLKIKGPICTWGFRSNVDFEVLSVTGEQIGRISKKWGGFVREVFTDADNFGINFPLDLDVRMKATLLGASFLIDAMFFDTIRDQQLDAPGMG